MYSCKKFTEKSCLSPAVKKLFRSSISLTTESCLITKLFPSSNSVISSRLLLLNWDIIYRNTCGTPENQADYGHSIRNLAPFLAYVMKNYECLNSTDISSHLQWTKWTQSENVLSHCWNLLAAKESQCDILLATLLLTAYFEHFLGNVFLIKGKRVPFLMKDLLVTKELQDVLGQEPVQVLRLLMGIPTALNLRNVLWHGFMSPSEIDARYGLFLIAAAVTLGSHLQTEYQSIPKRNLYHFENCTVLTDFPDTVDTGILQQIFEKADALPQMKPYFYYSLHLFEQKRFGECVVMLLPNLECTLRCMFASANQCPERILTAENDTFYTTFDEILSRENGKGGKNYLLEKLSGNLFEMLLDVLNYQQGPRVRDRLSHGEVALHLVPEQLASHLLHLCACVCLNLSDSNTQCPYISTILKTASNYKAHFHPTSLLISKIRELLLELLTWDSVLKEMRVGVQTHAIHDGCNCFPDIISSIGLDNKSSLVEYCDLLSSGQQLLHTVAPCTLFRPRQELEAVSALHHITANLLRTCVNIRTSVQEKHHKFINRQLRSRQRGNYQKLLHNSENMRSGIIHLAFTVFYFLKNINIIGELDVKPYQDYLKFFKRTVQCSENLEVNSVPENNDWDGICQLLANFSTQLNKFNSQYPFKTCIL